MDEALHPRTIIIRHVRDHLTGQTLAGDTVYLNRLKPLFSKNMPALLLYAMGEDVSPESYQADGHAALNRTLKIGIEIVFAGKGDDVVEQIDQTAAAIERLLDGWQIKGFEPCVLRLQRTDFTAIEDKEEPHLLTRLTYDTGYMTPRHQQGQYHYEDDPFEVPEGVPGSAIAD